MEQKATEDHVIIRRSPEGHLEIVVEDYSVADRLFRDLDDGNWTITVED
jgi:hypothetical protein